MKYDFERHFTDASIEAYALGKLSAEELDRHDEHLLICEACREKLDETERYLRAMKAASFRLRAASEESGFRETVRRRFALPAGVWAAAAVVFCVVAFLAVNRFLHPSLSSAPVAVSLLAERGASTSAPAHRLLDLSLDARGLQPGAGTRVELVDSGGKILETQTANPTGDLIRFRVSRSLDAGSYYVRLYRSAELEREYSLDLK